MITKNVIVCQYEHHNFASSLCPTVRQKTQSQNGKIPAPSPLESWAYKDKIRWDLMKCLWHQINNFRREHLQSSTSLSLLSGWQSSGATNYLQSHSAKPTLILTSGSLFSHLRSAILMMVTSLFFMHQLVLFFVGEKAKYCIVIMAFCVFFVWWNCILYNFMQCVFKMLQIFIGLCSYVLTLRNKKWNLLVSEVENKILRIVLHKYRRMWKYWRSVTLSIASTLTLVPRK